LRPGGAERFAKFVENFAYGGWSALQCSSGGREKITLFDGSENKLAFLTAVEQRIAKKFSIGRVNQRMRSKYLGQLGQGPPRRSQQRSPRHFVPLPRYILLRHM
jgi:hypothetical protein